MQYWRMQLHPSESAIATSYAAQSLAAGFIGLDFDGDRGDLRKADPSAVKPGEKDFFDFAHRMMPDDLVLIIAHHFPFALVSVSGEYNYIARPEPELGVWFRHFRRINKSRTLFWADKVTNARDWDPLRMTDTISILLDRDSKSHRLIEDWRKMMPGV